MRTEQQQQFINRLVHHLGMVTPEEIQAITPEIINSKIDDHSHKAELSVAFVLALYFQGQEILAANSNALARQISAETLNAIIQQGDWVGQSVAFVLAKSPEGRAILTADNNTLGRMINAETLNAVIQQGAYAGWSVAYTLARSAEGRAILATNNNRLGRKINAETLNSIIPKGPFVGYGWSVAYALARSTPEGCAILAANNNELALRISAETLNVRGHSGKSVASTLSDSIAGRPILDKIKERHQNNNVMLALYSSKVQRLGKNSPIKALNRELLDSVLTMLDGRTPQRLSLK